MGWVEVRPNGDGVPRYQAKYRDVRGRKQAAGTFGSETTAKAAADAAEAKAHEGRGIDPRKGRQKFRKYVEDTWFPNHQLELRGRENYTIYLNAYIIPYFGKMSMIQIWPEDVRAFVKHLQEEGVPVSSIEYSLTVLSAIFTTALNDQVVFLHHVVGNSHMPCCGKKEGLLLMNKLHFVMKLFSETTGFVKISNWYDIASSSVVGPKSPKSRFHRSDTVPWKGVV